MARKITERRKLGELLVALGLINKLQLKAALNEQKQWGTPLGRTLVEMKFIDEETMIRVLSGQLNVPAVRADAAKPDPTATQYLDAEFCRQNECFPLRFRPQGRFLDVAMSDPMNQEVYDRIRVRTHCNVRPYLGGTNAIQTAILQNYHAAR